MGDNIDKTTQKTGFVLELLNDDEVRGELGEALASVMINPTVTWAKFILTDDRTNANGERVPKEEFPNLIRSGIHMPVKMALGEISPGHPNTKPLGTITHLKEVTTSDGSSAIVAIAALWGKERPADVEFLKQKFAEQKPVNVSWEILYEDASLNADTKSMDLFGTVLSAATIVGNPAYQGRTPFLSIAATKKSEATVEDDQENVTEDNLKTVEELQAHVAELEPKLTEAQTKITELETTSAEKDAKIAELTEKNTALEAEIAPLREFKASVDSEIEKQNKLAAIKAKFAEAKIEKDEKYFDDNSEKLLKMDESSLDFFIQELASNIAEASKETSASTTTKKTVEIPNLQGASLDESDTSVKSLAKHLRESRMKKISEEK